MSPDWSEMRQLHGQGFIADTTGTSSNWMETYIHPDDQPMVSEAVAQAVLNRCRFELEHRVLRIDGTLGWTHSRAVPLLNESGEITEWIGAASDITSRKSAGALLRESEARLQIRVAEATTELRSLSRRLIEVQEEERRHLARELHDEIGQVLTGLSFQLGASKVPDIHLTDARRTVRDLTEQVRQLSMDLRPVALERY